MPTPSNVNPPKHTEGRDMKRTLYSNEAGNSISGKELRKHTGKSKKPDKPARTQLKKRASLIRG